MLYDVNADCLVDDEIITIHIEADSIVEAEEIGYKSLPTVADRGSMWIVPNPYQPIGGLCFKALIYTHNMNDPSTQLIAAEYFDRIEDAIDFASGCVYGYVFVSHIVDNALEWLNVDFEGCNGECDVCKHRRTVPGTDERIDREPAYYCDREVIS